jgi:NAD(P)-dependent dehydrogenase (short-subunit alcohol dehydrogenase family)
MAPADPDDPLPLENDMIDPQAKPVLVVTGGSRGIGAATAKLAAAQGWRVMTTYLGRAAAAAAVVQEIRASGGEAATMQVEVADEAAVKRLFDVTEATFGRVTGLVNNAGVDGGPSPLADLTVEELRHVLDINVLGLMLCCREAVRRMSIERGGAGGSIVNIGSIAARLGSPGERVHYAGSKGAVASFTTGLAREAMKSGIRVNCVVPGVTATDMVSPERIARMAPTIPAGRAAQPEEIARAVVFLLSPEQAYVTGAEIMVSGGR